MNVSDAQKGPGVASAKFGGLVALFFDQDWFQARLSEADRTHDALARAAGLTVLELAAVWKDQMEITREMVEGFASVLGTDLTETASRCGISGVAAEAVTPEAPKAQDPKAQDQNTENPESTRAMLKQIFARLDGIDQSLATLHETIAARQLPDK